jgi:hypothetical protein
MGGRVGSRVRIIGVPIMALLSACQPKPLCTSFAPGNANVSANGGPPVKQTICTHGTLDVSANGQASVTIDGYAERVRVMVVDHRSNVDLTGLENTDVEFLGVVNGVDNGVGSTVQVSSKGEVRFDAEVDGQSHVRVKAGNNVIFHKKIDGASVVCVDAPGNVTGPEVNGRSAVFAAKQPSSLSFATIDGGSTVQVGACPF